MCSTFAPCRSPIYPRRALASLRGAAGANWTLARLKEHRSTARFDAVLHVGDIVSRQGEERGEREGVEG